MKTATKVLVFIVITAATAGIVSLVQYRSAKHEAELDKVNTEPHQPGIVSFKAGGRSWRRYIPRWLPPRPCRQPIR